MDAPQTPTPQEKQQYAEPPANANPPETGTWLKLDARDPEAEAAEAAYLKESARVRRGVWIGNVFAFIVDYVLVALLWFVPDRRIERVLARGS